jgi:hypothetical protein
VPTPFGKYADLLTTLVAAFLVVAAVLQHALVGPGGDYTFIDAAALLAVGQLYGKQAASNGYAKEARAAHRRLDSIGAPPADDGGPP